MMLRNLKLFKVPCYGLTPSKVQFYTLVRNQTNKLPTALQTSRSSGSAPRSNVQQSSDDAESDKQIKAERKPVVPSNCRYVYPEFLPDPKMEWRNSLREKLERLDMIQRRKHIDIPEFYVGRFGLSPY